MKTFAAQLAILFYLQQTVYAQSSAPATSSGSAQASSSPGTISANPSLSHPPTVAVTLASTNPTAIPLASINPAAPAAATHPLDSTFAAGSTPSAVPGAPLLPDISQLNPANYPPLDKPPPTNTPEVQQWIQEVQSSGIFIPAIPPTLLGGCPANPAAAANATSAGQCWWTCGHCTRATDIVSCPDKLTWGLSFDDGPSPYTPDLLQFLDENQLKTTFFVVGSRVISRPQFAQTEYMDGHQLSVHTWSHSSLTTQTTEAIIAEFGWSKKVIKDVIGVTPNTFRPPFGDIDDRVRAIARAMGLTPIIWTNTANFTFDTNDFNIPAGSVSASQVIVNFENILNTAPSLPGGFIVLEHDLFQQTVELATGYILPQALATTPKLTLKPIISCLNKPLSDAYIETNSNSTNPPPNSSAGASGVTTLSSGAPGSAQNPTAAAAAPSSATIPSASPLQYLLLLPLILCIVL